jgi:hypothetical protein
MFIAMAGLVPAIHVFLASGAQKKDVDARHKAGHDEGVLRGEGEEALAATLTPSPALEPARSQA